MVDLDKVKLIIWDLDETFWDGILSDHTAVFREENGKLIMDMADAGVISAICSKNDEVQVNQFLEDHGIKDLFVFNSINWTPKGARVKQIITEMNLRAVNVLFVDDNPTNLGEALEFCPDLMISDEKIIPALREYYSNTPKKDLGHKRLEQYRVLERKQSFRALSDSNEDFLRKCQIRVEIKDDCQNHLARIEDLVLRSNQLNFTKVRSSADELKTLIDNPEMRTGYVEVKDKFGDYGIVGFFAIENNVLRHFVFSCRTLNMGVEQYVYYTIGRPKLEIVGEVSSDLNVECPDWINRSENAEQEDSRTVITGKKVLFKGPCDMQQLFSFIKETPDVLTEFTYVNNRGVQIEQGNHTTHIVESFQLDRETQYHLEKTLPFGDSGMFRTRMFDSDIGVVVLSMLTDPNLGLYQEKSTGAIVAFGEYTNDLTNESVWDDLLSGNVFTANCRFKKADLEDIRRRFRFLGRIRPEMTVANLEEIYARMAPGALLVLCLGSEMPYERNTQTAYDDRHLYHGELNRLIRKWAEGKDRVRIMDVNRYIHDQEDFTNNINHYQKSVYFSLCEELLSILGSGSEPVLQYATKRDKQKEILIRSIKKIPNMILRKLHGS